MINQKTNKLKVIKRCIFCCGRFFQLCLFFQFMGWITRTSLQYAFDFHCLPLLLIFDVQTSCNNFLFHIIQHSTRLGVGFLVNMTRVGNIIYFYLIFRPTTTFIWHRDNTCIFSKKLGWDEVEMDIKENMYYLYFPFFKGEIYSMC